MSDKQVVMILRHLKAGRKIEPLQALRLYGCQRLAARVQDIEEMGYVVLSRFIRVKKADGSFTRVKQYWM